MILTVIVLIQVVLVYRGARPRPLEVSFLDVGQGDAVLIEAPNGNQLLYDAGPASGAILRRLSEELPHFDRSIDMLVFSHPDLDHIGGALDVLDRYRVDVILESPASGASEAFDLLQTRVAAASIDHLVARTGMHIDLGSGVVATVLSPSASWSTEDTNASSITLRVTYGSTSFLVSGDLSRQGEYRILDEQEARVRAQVVKLGHHGSKTSTSARWLEELDPDVVVVSAGLGNRYGHPDQEVLTLLERLHIPVARTDREGTIRFQSDGQAIVRK